MWALWCLLPMLWMSVLSPAPHSHEVGTFARILQTERAEGAVLSKSDGAPQNRGTGGEDARTFPVLAPQGSAGHGDLCWLCQWASIAGACLMVALSLWLWQPLLRALLHPLASWFFSPAAALALRSRAPPF